MQTGADEKGENVLRVIAGRARRLLLKTVPGDQTRPTTDRIKETLFNILQTRLDGIRFLDLYAGSGGIGIEALSRGAAYACFVDESRSAAECIRQNLATTHLEDFSQVLTCDAVRALSILDGQPPFQIIFMDPPYRAGEPQRVFAFLDSHRPSYVDDQTQLIVEMALDEDFSQLEAFGFSVERVKTYKTNQHIFFRRDTKEEGPL